MPLRISFHPDLRFNTIRVTRSWVMDLPAVYAAFFTEEERLVLGFRDTVFGTYGFGWNFLGLMDLDGIFFFWVILENRKSF